MPRSRKNSVIQDVAANPGASSHDELPPLFGDSSLRQKVDTLLATVETEIEPQVIELLAPEWRRASALGSANDEYTLYSGYVAEVDTRTGELEDLLTETSAVNHQLGELVTKFNEISLKVAHFQETTDVLHTEYDQLAAQYEQISTELSHFEALDPVMRKLNQYSSANVVKRESFRNTLRKINSSLEFMDAHPMYSEVGAYRLRFKQCLVRSCSLIVNYLTNFLRGVETDVNSKLLNIANGTSGSASRDALLYNKFAAAAEEFSSLLQTLQQQVNLESNSKYREELASLLDECYEHYFRIRDKLLQHTIRAQLEESAGLLGENIMVRSLQQNILFFTKLCEKEYNIFSKFFPQETDLQRINDWLYQLCEPLHDSTRADILRESSITHICDAITLLNKYYQFEESSTEYSLQFGKVRFDRLFEPILQDLQARLIFRAEAYVQRKVTNYTPPKEDTDKRTGKGTYGTMVDTHTGAADEDHSLLLQFLENYELPENGSLVGNQLKAYYPSLLYALALLSKVYQLVNSSVFDNLAHHIVHDCIQSLKGAYQSSPDFTHLDDMLTYLKNLLMLRDQVQHFDIQYSSNETYLDFSGLGELINSIRKGSFPSGGSGSVLSLARETVPKIVNNMIDARSEIVVELRNLLNTITTVAARDLLQDTLQVTLPDALPGANLKLKMNIEERLPKFQQLVAAHMPDQSVAVHIVHAVRNAVVQEYSMYIEGISAEVARGAIPHDTLDVLLTPDLLNDLFDATMVPSATDGMKDSGSPKHS
ncbi:AGR147Wp [Eremothecium gossypii ATCC 10895]|uniref:Conserved oligomeric Golgi complex subunit 3 n=1 Tax=Eremothecium gossypii (strain ATCC 10895 / CBS 109.51 / FGSC 9923 / NRRL Y-1056) TaxID=284811 RepID=Q74ZQ1_EREGS|nr:AGR147Wp [Eremothecium gossypii ATCC 10895]AAS54637.1 AGR147Wp [Eremothecium gossypii ATCC 10895]AEY98967.1 FAGR147Wp [Eremothecium gossypii FDAG1]